ncbi:MAG: hypothetical protein Satyrvirus27_10 [Satyrvirus sp.]|uniref:Uncharacterized protein n=1 Tax=Satyrvirus sp. TaxID=2487771 RepID=A0A3G5AIL4_9VIRU|nr:MAG: hypothetical protein Satyrvirus27_10 [Satyrvirus sp.]
MEYYNIPFSFIEFGPGQRYFGDRNSKTNTKN